MRKVLLFISVIVFISIMTACSNNDENVEEETVNSVEVEKVKKDDLRVTKSTYGVLMPKSQSPIMIEQPGEISEIKVENGDEVSKDDVVAKVKTSAGEQEIKAPKSGEVGKLTLSKGDMTSTEDPLMVIADLDTLNMSVSIANTDKKLYKTDEKVDIEIDEETYEGKIMPIDPLPNDSGQYDVKIEVDNDDGDIEPGVTGKLLLKETKVKDALLVPTESIIQELEDDFVYIVEDGKAKKVNVDIIETQSDVTAVEGDLKKKDEVITTGHFTLTDDSEVEIAKDENE